MTKIKQQPIETTNKHEDIALDYLRGLEDRRWHGYRVVDLWTLGGILALDVLVLVWLAVSYS